MSKRRINILLGTLALILGFLIYILFRTNTYIAKPFEAVRWIEYIRRYLLRGSCDFIKFYFPDFLWGFSLNCGLVAIYLPGFKGNVVCGCVAFFCGCIWEALQYIGVVNGTGDIVDITMYLLASIFNIIINLKETRRNEKN